MKAVNIEYDTDNEPVFLPKEIKIPNGIDKTDIADYISDETDFCVKAFSLSENS